VLRRFAHQLADHLGFSSPDQPSRLSPDEELVFFPTLARRHTDGSADLRIHGWLFLPEHDSRKRAALLYTLAHFFSLGDPAKFPDDALATFKARARPFLVSNECAKRVAVSIGGRSFVMPRSTSNGHFAADLTLDPVTTYAATDPADPGSLGFSTMLPSFAPHGPPRVIEGRSRILPDEGVSVVTDIDDTIKVSNVRSKRLLLRSTFTEPFVPVAGMSAFLAKLAPHANDAVHYLSAAPWQLHAPLAAFLHGHHFPEGSLHLRAIRLKDRSLLQLFKEPTEHKLACVRRLLARWPRRRVILVGDSSEQDPEIYATLAREHPRCIEHVYIRDTTGESMTSARYKRSLWTAMEDRWTLFVDPAALPTPSRP
jgi:hypothetical protein